MSWSTVSSDAVTAEFTPQELAAINAVRGSESLPGILSRVISEIRGYIQGGGYPLDSDETTIPSALHNDAIDLARWRLLASIPKATSLQTDARKEAAERAMKKLESIAAQNFSVEKPEGSNAAPLSGAWNSENKLIMRTHPVPRPATQFSPQTNTYANPDAPADQAAS